MAVWRGGHGGASRCELRLFAGDAVAVAVEVLGVPVLALEDRSHASLACGSAILVVRVGVRDRGGADSSGRRNQGCGDESAKHVFSVVILMWEAIRGKRRATDVDEPTAAWSTEKSGVSLCLSQALIEGRHHLCAPPQVRSCAAAVEGVLTCEDVHR